MARDKRKRNMDKPTGSALDGLAAALAGAGIALAPSRQPGEFTAEEAAPLFGKSPCTTRRRLSELVKEGKATRRPVTLNGVAGFFYRLL